MRKEDIFKEPDKKSFSSGLYEPAYLRARRSLALWFLSTPQAAAVKEELVDTLASEAREPSGTASGHVCYPFTHICIGRATNNEA